MAVWEWNSAVHKVSKNVIVGKSFKSGEQLTRVGHLEQNVLHDVGAVGALVLELVALEQDIVETPAGGRQHGVQTTLTLLHLQNQVDGTLAGVTGRPRLARHGVGGVAVGTKTLAIHPRLSDRIGGLLLIETQHLGDHSGGRNLDQDDVVQANLVVRVLQSENTLNLVGLDHGLENIPDLQDLAIAQVAACAVGAGDPVCDSQDTAQVVRRVTPFGSEPAVIVVEPADHGTDIESAIDRVELVGGTGHTGAIGDHGAVHDRTEQLGALLELEGLQTTAEGVQEHQASSVELNCPGSPISPSIELPHNPLLTARSESTL